MVELTNVALTNGKFKLDKFANDITDANEVTFSDGGDLTNVKIGKIGKGDGEEDKFIFDLANFNDDFTLNIVSEGPEDCFVINNADSFTIDNSGVYTITYTGTDGMTHVLSLDPGAACVMIATVCFAPETMIQMQNGEKRAGDLQPGDMVRTRKNGLQPVRWIGIRHLSFESGPHKLKPIVFPRGSLGANLPHADLKVSPQHRMALTLPIKQGEKEAFSPAKAFVGLRNIRQMNGQRQATYVAIMFDTHQILTANGVAAESFWPGEMALQSLPPNQKSELLSLFPKVAHDGAKGYGRPALPFLKVSEAKMVIAAQFCELV